MKEANEGCLGNPSGQVLGCGLNEISSTGLVQKPVEKEEAVSKS